MKGNGDGLINRKSCKIKSSKSTNFFIFLKVVQRAELESLLGQFWAPSLMFDTPAIVKCVLFLLAIGLSPSHFCVFCEVCALLQLVCVFFLNFHCFYMLFHRFSI